MKHATRHALLSLFLAMLSACSRAPSGDDTLPDVESAATGLVDYGRVPVRITMGDLHRGGGTPPGWRFSPPPGDPGRGRVLFARFSCHSCHAVRGESFPTPHPESRQPGPDLSGMGAHHPPEYFAESILNPSAVIVEGPGYASSPGESNMPSYDDMTLQELADLVAYLKSLGGAEAHPATAPRGRPDDNLSYFAQAYEIDDPKIDEFYDWFDREGFRGIEGLVRIDTWISRTRAGRHSVLCLFGFDGDAALEAFLRSRAADRTPGDFVRPVSRPAFESPPLYRAVRLTREAAPAGGERGE